jgi:stage V sporulation protein D (sporulation-specific penicillin-binding protein)
MYDYIEGFGYGSVSGIDFAGEQSGILIPRSVVTVGDLARIGFGQSIAVTAIQLANAVAATVNGGYLYEPRLVKEVRDKDGRLVVSFSPKVKSRPISAETSREVARILEGVCSDGSGRNAFIEGYQVGGKTGTAQKFVNGKLAEGKYVSSFVGFFPASSPKYLALVIVDEPVGMSYGSMVAAPYAKHIFEQIIYAKNLPRVA